MLKDAILYENIVMIRDIEKLIEFDIKLPIEGYAVKQINQTLTEV